MSRGCLFVVSAPSGTGKTSLVAALVERLPQLLVSISHTTRPIRSGEVDGVNYFFVDRDAFDGMVAGAKLLEHAEVFGHAYGTSKDWVLAKLDAGHDVVLEIDTQGASQVREMYHEAVSIFILPPSLEALQLRLNSRRQDDAKTIASRLGQVHDEMAQFKYYDYLVVNDDFEVALSQLALIVSGAALRTCCQKKKHEKVLASFHIKV